MLEDVLYVEETKVTVRKYRHRTTIPAKIFKLLNLKDGDSLRWIAMKDGKILIEKKSIMRSTAKRLSKFP
jgi:AbrB family looped-hinge helix DNA binding protein